MASFIILYIKLVKESKLLFRKLRAKAHNPEVGGSNPAPATIEINRKDGDLRALLQTSEQQLLVVLAQHGCICLDEGEDDVVEDYGKRYHRVRQQHKDERGPCIAGESPLVEDFAEGVGQADKYAHRQKVYEQQQQKIARSQRPGSE